MDLAYEYKPPLALASEKHYFPIRVDALLDDNLVSSKPYWKGSKPMNLGDPDTIEFEVNVARTPAEWLGRRR